jgi:uncharacterized protein YkuJ
MDKLEVGQVRRWENGGKIFTIKHIGLDKSFYELEDLSEHSVYSSYILEKSSIYTPPTKKTEKVTWYRISYHKKGNNYAFTEADLVGSIEVFLSEYGTSEGDYHWIKLEEVYTHEYEVGE